MFIYFKIILHRIIPIVGDRAPLHIKDAFCHPRRWARCGLLSVTGVVVPSRDLRYRWSHRCLCFAALIRLGLSLSEWLGTFWYFLGSLYLTEPKKTKAFSFDCIVYIRTWLNAPNISLPQHEVVSRIIFADARKTCSKIAWWSLPNVFDIYFGIRCISYI